MVGCLLLKHINDYGDETLVKAWVLNAYMRQSVDPSGQYFCGEAFFQYTFPFDPSRFVHFRKRIVQQGVTTIFNYSVAIYELEDRVNQAMSDTTVQENDVLFPANAKLAKKVIDHCNRIASADLVGQRQSYVGVIKKFLNDSYSWRSFPRPH